MTTRLTRATTATVVSLCRHRVRRRLGPRLAWGLAVLVTLAFAGLGGSVDVGGEPVAVLSEALRWLCWLGAGPVALSVAAAPRRRDREEGIAAMAALHGVGEGRLMAGRFIAASVEASLRVVVPALACYAIILASGRRIGGAVVVVGVVAAGLMAGVLIGALGAACGLWGAERGRAALVAVTMLPWAVADQWSMPALSLPGVVDLAITFFVEGGA